jgi:hypothetical protein
MNIMNQVGNDNFKGYRGVSKIFLLSEMFIINTFFTFLLPCYFCCHIYFLIQELLSLCSEYVYAVPKCFHEFFHEVHNWKVVSLHPHMKFIKLLIWYWFDNVLYKYLLGEFDFDPY